jgi:hypothetical protein
MSLPANTFHVARNDVRSTVAVAHAPASGVLVVDDGEAFGDTFPIWVTPYHGTGDAAVAYSILEVTGREVNTLTVSGAAQGTADVGLAVGVKVAMLFTSGHLAEIQQAVQAVEDGAVHLTGDQSIAGTKTLTDGVNVNRLGGANPALSNQILVEYTGDMFLDSSGAIHLRVGGFSPGLTISSDTSATLPGALTVGSVSGGGSGLTSLNASSLATGTVGTARLGSGIASSSTYLRGDRTWADVSGGSGGTVTTVSVTTANGVSGSVATATSTPAITLTLGAITPTSVTASGTLAGSNLSGTNTGDQDLSALTAHVASTSNPHSVTRSQVGLGSVDNTSDLGKPISTATAAALAAKAPLASPTFTGTPAAPTATVGTNTTQLATTAFVIANAGGGPGGSSGQVQYNNAGSFAGGPYWDAALGLLGVASSPREAIDAGTGKFTGGTYSANPDLTCTIDCATNPVIPVTAIRMPGGSQLNVTEAEVFSLSYLDCFFQAQAATSNGYGYLESWESAGMCVGTGNLAGTAGPVVFRPNRTSTLKCERTGGVTFLLTCAASSAPNRTLFEDSSNGNKLSYKDSGGTVNVLY